MKQKKILFCDMDGVIADFDEAIFSLMPELHGMTFDQRFEHVDLMCQSQFKNIFLTLYPIDGGISSVLLLMKHYDVYFLSTPMWAVPESYTDKRIWLEKMFGAEAKKKLILSHNKGLCNGDYLIDDRKVNGVETFQGEHIHFGQAGFETWEKVVNYLKEKDNWGNGTRKQE